MQSVKATLMLLLLVAVTLFTPAGSRACSRPPAISLSVVARASLTGPIVLLASCSEAPPQCDVLASPLAVVRVADGSRVSGVTHLRRDTEHNVSLLEFMPDAPLERAVLYRAALEGGAASVTWEGIASSAVAAPLDGVSAHQGTRTASTGQSYRCDLQASIGECVTTLALGWTKLGIPIATLGISVGPVDGWLFTGGNAHWQPTASVSTDLIDGEERCLVLEAWNVLSDERQTRRLCKMLNAPERPATEVSLPTPDLGKCRNPPTFADRAEPADEFLTSWCRDRAKYCKSGQAALMSCSLPEPRCSEVQPDLLDDSQVQPEPGADAPTQPAADPDAVSDGAQLVDARADDTDGCNLSSGSTSWWMTPVWSVLALAWTRSRVLQRRRRAAD